MVSSGQTASRASTAPAKGGYRQKIQANIAAGRLSTKTVPAITPRRGYLIRTRKQACDTDEVVAAACANADPIATPSKEGVRYNLRTRTAPLKRQREVEDTVHHLQEGPSDQAKKRKTNAPATSQKRKRVYEDDSVDGDESSQKKRKTSRRVLPPRERKTTSVHSKTICRGKAGTEEAVSEETATTEAKGQRAGGRSNKIDKLAALKEKNLTAKETIQRGEVLVGPGRTKSVTTAVGQAEDLEDQLEQHQPEDDEIEIIYTEGARVNATPPTLEVARVTSEELEDEEDSEDEEEDEEDLIDSEEGDDADQGPNRTTYAQFGNVGIRLSVEYIPYVSKRKETAEEVAMREQEDIRHYRLCHSLMSKLEKQIAEASAQEMWESLYGTRPGPAPRERARLPAPSNSR